MTTLTWRAAACVALLTGAYVTHADTLSVVGEPSSPIITLTRSHGMVRGVVETPLVRVYDNGLVRIDLPSYMRGAGRYELRLGQDAFGALLGKLNASGLFDFDQRVVQTQRDAAVRARSTATGERFMTLDSTTTQIDLNFLSIAKGGQDGTALKQTIKWADLGIDAERFPELESLVGLAQAEKTLLELTRHADRQPVAGASDDEK